MIKKDIFLSISKLEAAFTAAHATNIFTSNAHGLQEGDLVQLTTSGADLPAGLAISTDYYIISRTVNTFQFSLTPGGSAVDITDNGTGTHTFHLKGKVIFIGGYKHHELELDFSDSPAMTVKIQISGQEDVDFNASQGDGNDWDYVEIVDLEDGSTIDGDTGITVATADHRKVELNINRSVTMTVIVTSWTTGQLGAKIRLFD